MVSCALVAVSYARGHPRSCGTGGAGAGAAGACASRPPAAGDRAIARATTAAVIRRRARPGRAVITVPRVAGRPPRQRRGGEHLPPEPEGQREVRRAGRGTGRRFGGQRVDLRDVRAPHIVVAHLDVELRIVPEGDAAAEVHAEVGG